ncbi:hypothetical protein ACFV42_49325, partial [Streptomyces solisilvae]|uniref:hypothetical protein n=2 Tax=Streptomyces TaxID=1883 RepID=UPI0036B35E97
HYVDLLDKFNSEAFEADATDGSPESGPDFNFPLFKLTGNFEDGWVQVTREGRGTFDDEVCWIRPSESGVEVREDAP